VADRQVAVELIAKISGYKANLQTAAASTREFGGELDKMRKGSKENFDQLSKGVTIAGAALSGLVGWAVKVGMEFDKQMSEVQAITNATAKEMGTLRQAALDAGQATVFSATDAAKAEAELAKAGLSTADILGGALTGALSLAAAGSLGLSEAAEVAAKTMGQFNLTGKDVGHIADLLAGAANATATDVHDLGEALKMGGLAASTAGFDVEQTTTVLAAFAKNAMTGSDAGTSLKTMLMMLESPSIKAQAAMDQYGFSVYDASGKMVDAYTLAGKLKTSFGNLTQEERNAAFATIFGADAMRSANVMYKEGADGLHNVNKELLAQADAGRVASQKTNNLSGDIERLKGSLESAMITAQSGATGPLRFLTQTLDHMVGTFSTLPSGVQQSIFILAGLTGGALLAAVAFMKVKNAVGDALDNLREAGPVSAKVADGLSNTAKGAAKVALAFAALQVAGAVLSAIFDKELNPQVNALADGLDRYGKTGQLSGEALRIVGASAGDLGRDLNGVANGGFAKFSDGATDVALGLIGMNSPLDDAKARISAMDQAFAQMVSSGHADEAGAAFKRIWEEAQRQHISLEALQAAFPSYIAAVGEAAKATDGSATSAEAQATQAKLAEDANRKLAGAFGAAATAADGLINTFKLLNGGMLDWRSSERDAEAAVDALQAALKASNGSLSVHTEKGRAAAAAVDAVAEAAGKAAQAKMNETGSVTEANKVYQGYIDQLRATLLAAGHTKAEVDALVGSIASMPSSRVVTITANVNVNTSRLDKVLKQLGQSKGGVLSYAGGGTYENHIAQIAPAGAMRQWAEPETGGEAYIPLAAQKRSRSVATLAEVDRRFGHPLSGGGTTQVELIVTPAPGADGKVMSAITEGLRFGVRTVSGGSAQVHLGPRGRN
jgi:TP901 family phage tail tape measure protein